MITAIGIDAVDTERFMPWYNYPTKMLQRIFSDAEIDYAKSNPTKCAERLAVRFAAKEALYKALFSILGPETPALLKLCRYSSVSTTTGIPHFVINWDELTIEPCTIMVSMSHTSTVSVAMVVVKSI